MVFSHKNGFLILEFCHTPVYIGTSYMSAKYVSFTEKLIRPSNDVSNLFLSPQNIATVSEVLFAVSFLIVPNALPHAEEAICGAVSHFFAKLFKCARL